jgi:hypothetical protein
VSTFVDRGVSRGQRADPLRSGDVIQEDHEEDGLISEDVAIRSTYEYDDHDDDCYVISYN